MKKLSIKLKVTIWYTVVMIIISAAALFAMNSFSRNMMEASMENGLKQAVNEMAKQIASRARL